MDFIFFVLGFPLLIGGAYALVGGGSALALRLGLSELVVGLTVVALGTSAPELMVSVLSAFQGAPDVAVGNVVGSNLANILLILGLSALIAPLALERTVRWREIPFALLSTLVLVVLANDHLLADRPASTLDRGDGLAILGYFAVFMYYIFSMARRKEDSGPAGKEPLRMPAALVLVAAGVFGLALGGQWLVEGAKALATSAGLSQALIGLTIVAVGTSLPEMATSILAAIKGNADMAVGNVVGSNILNILWILGLTATITPIEYNPELNLDIWFLVTVTILFFVFTFTGKRHKVDRREGLLFVALYAGYVAFLIIRG